MATLLPVLAYIVTATLTAGIQASPGAGTLNLTTCDTLGVFLLAVAGLAVLLFTDDNLGCFSICLGLVALPTGLTLPWIMDINQPWHWVADRLGVI